MEEKYEDVSDHNFGYRLHLFFGGQKRVFPDRENRKKGRIRFLKSDFLQADFRYKQALRVFWVFNHDLPAKPVCLF
jgi:hypothetical protein